MIRTIVTAMDDSKPDELSTTCTLVVDGVPQKTYRLGATELMASAIFLDSLQFAEVIRTNNAPV